MLEEERHIALLVEQRETKDLGPCPGFVVMARSLRVQRLCTSHLDSVGSTV